MSILEKKRIADKINQERLNFTGKIRTLSQGMLWMTWGHRENTLRKINLPKPCQRQLTLN